MINHYYDQLHTFVYQSISDGIPPLFFWIIFGIVIVVFLLFAYKVVMKIYKSHWVRLVIYAIPTLLMMPIVIYAIIMMLMAHHIEDNQDVSMHQGVVEDVEYNDNGGYELKLQSKKHKIDVKNIVNTHDKSLKSESNPIARGDKIKYYQSKEPNVILKAVIIPTENNEKADHSL